MKLHYVIFLIILASVSARGQATQPASDSHRRPRIGLALEGGGALGLAHIGVLEWLEKNHIPVDVIAGTSMGGLIGGVYAMGNSPQQIRDLVNEINWDQVLSGAVPFQDLSFRRKQDEVAYPNELSFGFHEGLQLPTGFTSGMQVGYILDREALPYSNLKSFDDLPIPFRCVATDLVSGKQVVFDRGSLPLALRSTMSVPGAFTPVAEGEHIYVDGSLVDNLPTDVVKAMGADIVIAVHFSTGTVTSQNIRSLFDVLNRSVDVLISENELRGMERADLVITVDLTGYSAISFSQSNEIIGKGTEAAQSKANILGTLRVGDAEWQSYLDQRNSRRMTDVPIPQYVTAQATTAQMAHSIENNLKKFSGQPLDTGRLGRDLMLLTGLGRFATIGYSITQQTGVSGLLIQADQKGYNRVTIKPVFTMDGADINNILATAGARITFLDLGGYRSEWRNDISFGSAYTAASEYYQPLSPESQWFIAPHADAGSSPFNIYHKNQVLSEYRIHRYDLGVDLGYELNRFSEVRAGYSGGLFKDYPRVGTNIVPSVAGRVGVSRIQVEINALDDPVFPRSGLTANWNFQWFDAFPGAVRAFPESELGISFFQRVSKNGSFYLSGSGGTTFGYESTGFPQFSLGGPLRISSYGANELLGNQYFLSRAGYLHEVWQFPPPLGKGLYVVSFLEAGRVYGHLGSSGVPGDIVGGVLAQTNLGPFFVGGSYGDAGHRKFFFQLGRIF